MLRKQHRRTAVVSILLVTITITLTLTLTVSAIKVEEKTTKTTPTIATTITRNTAHAKTTAVISKRLQDNNEAQNANTTWKETETKTQTTTKTKTAIETGIGIVPTISETTTTTFLTLQPPPLYVAGPTTATNHHHHHQQHHQHHQQHQHEYQPKSELRETEAQTVTTVETTKKNSINHKIKKANNVAVKSDMQQKSEMKKEKENGEVDNFPSTRLEYVEENPNLDEQPNINAFVLHPGRGFRTPIENSGYILFDDQNEEQSLQKRKQKKTETVNEVLSSLFPNGFSDIFRFSYASELETSTLPPADTTEEPMEISNTTTENVETTFTPPITTTTEQPIPKSSVSYTTSISKQYSRLISPGHTEIVVEKLPIATSVEAFHDGSNSISKTDLLRINRAAIDASVLPTLLLSPDQGNSTTAEKTTPKAPIIILKENTGENDDFDDEVDDDNQIAESQDIAQHIYSRLPNVNSINAETFKEYQNEQQEVEQQQQQQELQREQQEPQINIEIINDETLKQTQKRTFGQRLFTPPPELPKDNFFNQNVDSTPIDPSQDQVVPQQQDHYQRHAEKTFSEPDLTPEAPSRKFLKYFNPQLSESTTGLVRKGNFHYEQQGQQSIVPHGHYAAQYIQPAAQLEFHRQQEELRGNRQQTPTSSPPELPTPSSAVPIDQSYRGYDQQQNTLTQPNASENVVFVTHNTPTARNTPTTTPVSLLSSGIAGKSPHDYVSEAVAVASQRVQQSQTPKASSGYTLVEVQKSVNIHNKDITEKDGRLVEQHETTYYQPEYGKHVEEVLVSPQKPDPYTPHDYVSLSQNPINVQHIDSDNGEIREEAASYHAVVHQTYNQHPPPQPQNTVQVIEKVVPQPYPVPVEKVIDRPYPVTQVVEKPVPAPYPVKQIVEKVVDRPVPVEKIVERPIKVPYPVHVDRYVDRPYPVHEIIEQHIPIPYAVPEPVAVPVAFEHFIDRPYPVEKIVERRVPYAVETVVEKVVEKHVPVEKIVEKLVHRPIAIPIHVPVAVPVPMAHTSDHHGHPNELLWAKEPLQTFKIPPKVLQNYYARILKKLLSQKLTNTINSGKPSSGQSATAGSKKPKQPTTPIQFTKLPFKISDIFDLRPPPAPLGPSWSKSARYIYNTLPSDLTAAASFPIQNQQHFTALQPPDTHQSYDEYPGWRMGHLLKRSPDFGRNLHIEYGFKPPLVPSVEIDDKGVPLSASGTRKDE